MDLSVPARAHDININININIKGALTTYLSVDWFRNGSNEHPGITQQHTPDQYEGAGHEKKRWFSRRAAVKA